MTTILHLHIPRALGSSIHAHIAKALGKEHCISGNSFDSSREQASEKEEVKFATGHFFWGVHEYFNNSVYFVVLRNPIDRVGSIYDYVRSNVAHPKSAFYRDRSLMEMLHLPDVQKMQLSNGQVRQLAGPSLTSRAVSLLDFLKAMRNICRRNVVVTFPDQINSGLKKLAKTTGLDIPPDLAVSNAAVRTSIATGEAKRIRALNQWDTMLFYSARMLFGIPINLSAALVGTSLLALCLTGSARTDESFDTEAVPPKPAIIQPHQPDQDKAKKPEKWYSRPGSNGGPLDPQSSALTS